MGLLAQTHGKTATGLFNPASLAGTYNMLQGIQPGGMGVPPTRGTQQFLSAFSEMPWLNAVADRIATAVAQTEWQLYVERGPKKKHATWSNRVRQFQRCSDYKVRKAIRDQMIEDKELEAITEHPFLDLLTRANTYQTGFGMRRVTQLHIDLTGDAFWLKERDAQGTVVGVWPVPPHWIQSTPTPIFPYFRVMFRAWRALIPDTEWVWFSNDDPLNPYGRGTASARALGDELETDEYAAKYTKSFFFNSARPDLVVYPKNGQTLRDGETQRLEEDWQSKNAGFWRSFRAHFLSREVEVKELGSMTNMRAMQMIPLRQHERDVVLQVYGMPPEILGVLEHSNRATIDAAAYLMGKYVVVPRLEFQRNVLQERVVPEYDERLMLEYVSPVDDDRMAQINAATAAPWALNMNEWRALSGSKPMDDEDMGLRHMVLNTESLKSTDEIQNPPEPPPMVAPGMPGQAPPAGAPKPKPKPAADSERELYDEVRKFVVFDTEHLPRASAAGAHLEPGCARALRQAWHGYLATIHMDLLEQAVAHDNLASATAQVRALQLGNAQTDALGPLLAHAFRRGAELASETLRQHGVPVRREGEAPRRKQRVQAAVDFAAVNPLATRWAQEHAAALVKAPAEVRQAIASIIARANAEGLTPDQTARLIRDTIVLTPQQANAVMAFRNRLAAEGVAQAVAMSRTARYATAQLRFRSYTIARTEIMSALNGGQQALWSEGVRQGVIEAGQFRKTWIATEDELTCTEICEGMNDETAPIDEPFSNGEMTPPSHPRCRCTVGLVEG